MPIMGPPFKTPPSLGLPPQDQRIPVLSSRNQETGWQFVRHTFTCFYTGIKSFSWHYKKALFTIMVTDPCIQLCLVLINTEHRPNPILGFLPNDWKLKTAMPLRAQSENILKCRQQINFYIPQPISIGGTSSQWIIKRAEKPWMIVCGLVLHRQPYSSYFCMLVYIRPGMIFP